MVSFRVAASEYTMQGENSGFYSVTWFVSPDSKKIAKLQQGTQVHLSGKLKHTPKTDGGGASREYYDIIVNGSGSMDVLQQPKNNGGQQGGYQQPQGGYQAPQQPQQPQQPQGGYNQPAPQQGWNPPQPNQSASGQVPAPQGVTPPAPPAPDTSGIGGFAPPGV